MENRRLNRNVATTRNIAHKVVRNHPVYFLFIYRYVALNGLKQMIRKRVDSSQVINPYSFVEKTIKTI